MRVLEWYRVDRATSLGRSLGLGAGLMATGAIVIGLSFLTHQPENVRVAAAGVGLAFIVSGPAASFVGLRRLLAEDLYLALLPEGVLLHFEEVARVIPWDAIARVHLQKHSQGHGQGEGGAIVFELREGEPLEIRRAFAGITADALAARLDDARRKAGFHLLK